MRELRDPPARGRAVRRGPGRRHQRRGRTKADPDKPLEVTATGKGRLTDVVAVDASGRRVAGELSADGTRWRTTGPLAAAARYTVTASTENGDGAQGGAR
ncbi:Ig-like domain-containing protein [Actinomadura keratinilytica]